MNLLLLVTVLSFVATEHLPPRPHNKVKRSYVCPPNFVRQGHRCYFFSKEPATWQEALFHCRERHSSFAVIKSANQDKLIRNFLTKKTLAPLQRWLGGVYDWGRMTWKWAASGKVLTYNGFLERDIDEIEDSDKLKWQCIIMDPALGYRWSSRSCVSRKHYICHTKMKIVSSKKEKKKLQRQYNTDKFNKLNEIPVPPLPEYTKEYGPLKQDYPYL